MITFCVRICGKLPWNVCNVAKGTFSDVASVLTACVGATTYLPVRRTRHARAGWLGVLSPLHFPKYEQFQNITFSCLLARVLNIVLYNTLRKTVPRMAGVLLLWIQKVYLDQPYILSGF